MCKIVTLSSLEVIRYPVGEYIDENIHYIKDYCAAILQEIELTNSKYKNSDNKYKINIYCTGSSGAIIAAGIAIDLQHKAYCKIFHVPKKGESTHRKSENIFIGNAAFNVVVDDFIVSGNSIKRIIDSRNKKIKFNMLVVCSGIPNSVLEELKKDFKSIYYGRLT